MKKTLVFCILVIMISSFISAEQTDSYDWEDGGTVLGTYGNAVVENSTEQAYDGTHSLKYSEDPISGTPQAYVWWVTGLVDGDEIEASFYVYDSTPQGDYPKGRIWAHYTADPEDIDSYSGSASGNTEYSTQGWSQLSYTWTFEDDGDNDGFVVEARIYSIEDTNIIYVDATEITVSSDIAIIHSSAAPPTASIDKAYSISNTAMDVYYDLDLTSVDVNDYTLTGSETITFSNASIDASDAKLVHLTGASMDMIADLTLDNIYDADTDTDFDFYAGITPIALTNTLYPGKGHIENGKIATFSAVVTANDEYNNVWISDSDGAYNGILIYDYSFPSVVNVNDSILIYAERDEYSSLSELKQPVLLSSSVSLPIELSVIEGYNIDWTIPANTNPAEQWEGQLIKINSAVISYPIQDNIEYVGSDNDWENTFVIGDGVDYQFATIGAKLDSAVTSGDAYNIIGVVDWDYNDECYRINPRNVDDIISSPQPPNPVDLTILVSDSDIILNWSPGSKSTFNIYRSTDPYTDFSSIGTTSDTTYTDAGAAADETKYFYYITAE